MNQIVRLRLLVLIAFVAAVMLIWYGWHRMNQNVSNLVEAVESGSKPDMKLIRLKELWLSLSSSGAALQAYRSSSDDRILEHFLDQKDSLITAIDSLAIDGDERYNKLLQDLEKQVERKALLYQDLMELNYNRQVTSAIDKIGSMELNIDTLIDHPESGSFFQRLFSSKYSRKSLQSRTDSIMNERNLRLEEFRKNMSKVKEEEARVLDQQAKKEAILLSSDKVITENAGKILLQLEQLERDRLAGLSDQWQATALKSGDTIRYTLLLGIAAFALLFIILIIEVESANKRRKQLAEARQRSEKLAAAREEFMATMSHEIRTPLTSIIGFSENLQEQVTDKTLRRNTDAILGSSRHLLAIVNDVLDYTRIESGKLNLTETSFRAEDVFAEVYHAMEWKASEKGIELQLFAQPVARAVLFGDPVRLKQVLYNLTANAIRFTDKGTVGITATIVNEAKQIILLFKISDSGCGIPEDKLQLIFKEYEQVDKTRDKEKSGTGLGLAISHRIVKQLGGTIDVDSQVGLGSVFKVRIPYSWGDSAFAEQSFSEEETEEVLSGKRILVVEDEPLIMELVCQNLEHSGAVVVKAIDGGRALEVFDKSGIDLVLLDKQLPDMTGDEIASSIRAQMKDSSKFIPMLLMTAHLREEDSRLIVESIVDDIIQKPFTAAEIIEKITRLFKSNPQPVMVQENVNQQPTISLEEISETKQLYTRPYDLHELIRSSEGNPEFVKKMINLFLSGSFASLNNLKFHLRTANYEQLGKTAHRMIGSCKQLGLDSIASELKSLELLCENEKDETSAIKHVDEIDKQFQEVFVLLKEELKKV